MARKRVKKTDADGAPKSKRAKSVVATASSARKMPKRAAACSDFKDKSVRLPEKDALVETKRKAIVEDEIAAIGLTAGEGGDDSRPNRRLTDFIFHDAKGNPRSVEMLEFEDVYITGVILPLEASSDNTKETGFLCEGFGRVESWAVSGYDEGSPVIWVSTDDADYDCVKPNGNYKALYSLFFEKAHACVEVYKVLSRTSGGNPDLSVDELIARVVRSMNDSKNFPDGTYIKDFIISQGEFIYNQLIGLDETSNNNERAFVDLPVLVALRDESKKQERDDLEVATESGSMVNASLKICEEKRSSRRDSMDAVSEENPDERMAMLMQEQEYWRARKFKKNRQKGAATKKFYVKINEDEIANDYPLPGYYKPTAEEIDEYVVYGGEIDRLGPDLMHRNVLHNWSLYNSDSRLISLELLPMKPCADIDVTIFGSGIMTADDGGGWLDADTSQSSSGAQNVDGMPIYLSAIKEWMIEFGGSLLSISFRTDMSWYASIFTVSSGSALKKVILSCVFN